MVYTIQLDWSVKATTRSEAHRLYVVAALQSVLATCVSQPEPAPAWLPPGLHLLRAASRHPPAPLRPQGARTLPAGVKAQKTALAVMTGPEEPLAWSIQ